MKQVFFSGVAIAACFGLATTASAQQYGSNYQYSSYGNRMQEAAEQEAAKDAPTPSPSDHVAPPEANGTTQPRSVESGPVTYGSDCGTSGAYGYHSGPVYGGGNYSGSAAGCNGAGNSGPVYSGGAVSSAGAGCSGGGYADYSYGGGAAGYGGGAAGCGGGIGSNLLRSNDRNVVFGLRGLIFERDYEDDRGLGANAAGDYLFTTDADHGGMGGFETTLGVRNCSGSGWEFNYWGLFPDEADVTFNGPGLTTALGGLASVDLGGFNAANILNTADSWRLYRRTEIHNVEINLLRNAGSARGFMGGSTNIEWIAGLRWLKFSEDMRLASNNSNAGYPTNMIYDIDVENNLVGFQFGARAERCIRSGLTLSLGTKFGIYNNDIYTRQSIRNNADGTVATVPSGPVNYQFAARKDDIATLGELDLGLNYQFSRQWRANLGYRAIGVSSVALAADQIPYNFDDTQNIQRVKSNGSLLLHGAYFGVERSF